MTPPRIFVSAGDVSGDVHGANLIRAILAARPDAQIAGLGGPRMAEAGARLLADTSWFGIIGVGPLLGSFWRYAHLLGRADRFLATWRPDVAVTIDCPGFHFLLGSRLRARRIPTLWYIPPQLWAWAPWRVRKLARRFTRVACVLPHEEEFFREAGVPVRFVGHPVIDHLRGLALDEGFIASLRARPGERLVALMPGSRRQEVGPILARQLAAARAILARHKDCRFVVPLAEPRHRAWDEPAVAASGLPVRIVVGKTHEVERAADLALVASGTATLELAFYGTPMAVFYNVTWTQWHLVGRWLVRTPYLSLPNALAGRRIVPEFIRQRPLGPAEMAEVMRLLEDEGARREVRDALAAVRHRIERSGSSRSAAREVLGLIGMPIPSPPRWRPTFAM